jgi:hypothetical protein
MPETARLTDLHPPGTGRVRAPDEVWARVREDYLAGMSAADACRRHGVGVAALRDRAAREGWRRIDQPWIPPNGLDAWDEGVALTDRTCGDLDEIELPELSWVAHRRMLRAVLRGDAAEALRWRRVRIAMDDEAFEIERLGRQREFVRDERPGVAEPREGTRAGTDSTDSTDSIFGGDG